jgi:hypothetical protein
MYTVFIVQAYQTSQYVVPRGGIFLGKWRSAIAGNTDGKMNVQSACALNTRYKPYRVQAGSWTHPAFCPIGTGGSYAGCKAAGA